MRKDVSSGSAVQAEGSPAASSPADAPPRLPESAAEEEREGGGGGGGPEGEGEEEEAPNGVSSFQERAARREAACR